MTAASVRNTSLMALSLLLGLAGATSAFAQDGDFNIITFSDTNPTAGDTVTRSAIVVGLAPNTS